MTESDKGRLNDLTSWKEIADFLGVTDRTAQRWASERGLPVRRLPGGRGRVLASREEVAAWRDATLKRAGRWSNVQFLRRYAMICTVLLAVSIATILVLFIRLNPSSLPSTYKIENDMLVVLDSRGRELWRKVFEAGLDAHSYTATGMSEENKVWIGDVDVDGRLEVILLYRPRDYSASRDMLICYSDRGMEKWRFIPGREVETSNEQFSNNFTLKQFGVFRRAEERGMGIVVCSVVVGLFPTQVALLSPAGELLREYWHSGLLDQIAFLDMEGDGRSEIYLGGINNARKQATLVVLDPESMEGASTEENPAHQLKGFPAGNERARVFFPRTCINRKFHPYNMVRGLTVFSDSLQVSVVERLHVPMNVFYVLDSNLEVRIFDYGDGLRAYHKELASSGQLDHELTPEEEEDAMRNIEIIRPIKR